MKASKTSLNGYSCSNCNRFYSENRAACFYSGDLDESLFSAKDIAEKCCACDSCGEIIEKDSKCMNMCKSCVWRSDFKHMILNVYACLKLGITNELVWQVVSDQLDYGQWMHALETELKRYPSYQEKGTTAFCGICEKLCTHSQELVKGVAFTNHLECVKYLERLCK